MASANSSDPLPAHDPWAAFRIRNFALLQVVRVLGIVAFQMMAVALYYDIYEHTHSALNLGLIGLVQFVPAIAFSLITGTVADRFNRRHIVQICQVMMIISLILLVWVTRHGITHVWSVYAIMFLIGTERAFQAPAAQALMPQLVPRELFSNAVAWNGSIFNLSTIAGPSLGGLLYGLHGEAVSVYGYSLGMMVAAVLIMGLIKPPPQQREATDASWETLVAGIRFVFDRPVVLGAISLDLFAVLLGGAVALLPIYAKDILHVGPQGLGFLRASFAVGAVTMGFLVTHLPPMRQAGKTMLWSVAGFGVFTIIFGISSNFWLSLVCLFLLGAFDMVSVVVRHTMVQLATPDEMRGRVSAVNMIFIGASNELGEFESGLTAAWWGAIPAVVIGGIGTLAVTALWAWWFPALRKFKRLDQPADTTSVDKAVVDEVETNSV
jgi:MFS family permease